MSASHPGRPPGWCNETNALHCCHVVDGIKDLLYHNGQNSAKKNTKKQQKRDFSQESLKVGRQNVWRYIGTLRGALVKMLKLHTGILFFGKSLQHASEINETLVLWMPPEGPRTPVAFHIFFAVLFWIKIPLRVCLFSNTIAPKSRLLNCYTTVVLLLHLRCYENILFFFFFLQFW